MGCGHSTAKVAPKAIQDLDSRKLRKIARAVGRYFDPEALLESISNGSIALTRGRWVVAHAEAGGKLMRRQDLPPEAFFTVDELRKLVAALGDDWGLLFVAISYRWLTATHPDPDAFHLNIVAEVGRLYLKVEREYNMSCSPLVDAFERAGYRRDEADFGLMWDFMSLHQKPVDGGERTPEEASLFKLGLGALPIWYGHAETVMWMQPELPDGFGERMAELGLAETYEGSGWCFVESSVSAGVKHGDRRLNLSLRTKEAMGVAYGSGDNLLPDWCLKRVCSANRQPPMDPDWVANELRTTKKFTGKGDVPVVEKLYRDYFEGVSSTATSLNFSGLTWGDVEAAQLVSMLPRYVSLVSLDMSQNRIGSDGAQSLSKALKTNLTFLELNIGVNGLGVDGAKIMADLLKTNTTLTSVGLADNALCGIKYGRGTYTAEGITKLSEALKSNSSLRELNVEYNELGADGAKHLAEALKSNSALQTLNLYDNNIRADGAKHLAEALKSNSTLLKLNLGYNSLNAEAAKHISDALKTNSTLEMLDLAGNALCGINEFGRGTYNAKGITKLAEALKSNSSLRELNIQSNYLDESAKSELRHVWKHNASNLHL